MDYLINKQIAVLSCHETEVLMGKGRASGLGPQQLLAPSELVSWSQCSLQMRRPSSDFLYIGLYMSMGHAVLEHVRDRNK